MERVKEVFKKYIDSNQTNNIKEKIDEITAVKLSETDTQKALITLLGCMDLTSLESTDNKESIWKLTDKVNEMDDRSPLLPNVASICVYSNLIAAAREALISENVNLCAVCGGFPSGQTYTEIKIAETALAISDGADEIDMVMNIGNLLNEDYEDVVTEIEEVKSTCGEKILKVILETGALKKTELIAKASVIAMYSGADFIKTSTGKIYPGATPEAVYTMCTMIKKYHEEHNKKIGIKIAGGIKTVDEALNFYKIIENVLGKEWLDREYFRIGTSKLFDVIMNSIDV
ncbi:MAG: deoxyribose-phosphate aldolase [Bacteroidales bacterium]|nr:deoxyribose-phosphate aldolase [Bacteroidales bacterium]